MNSADLLDFLRKYIIDIPDFVVKNKSVLTLGSAFLAYAKRSLLKYCDVDFFDLNKAIVEGTQTLKLNLLQ